MSLLHGIWATGLAILVLAISWAVFRCRHHWELVDKTEIPSRLETILQATGRFSYTWTSEITNIAYRRIVLAMRCQKCGRAKIFKIDSA